jgi:outer membrane protein TolC
MKIYRSLIVVCAALALLLPMQAVAGEAVMRLSLSDALERVRQNNYTIKAARSRVDQADGRVVQSRQAFLPKVTLSETLTITNDPGAALVYKLQQKSLQNSDFEASKMTHPDVINDFNTSLQVMQPIYNADASAARKMALTAKKAQEHLVIRTEETMAFQVCKVYYGLLLAKKNIEAVDQSIITMQGYSAEAAKGYSVGMLSKSDKLSTDIRLAELQEQKLLLQDEIKNASDMLKVMLRLDAGVTLVPTGDLVVDGSLPGDGTAASLVNRSDIKAYEAFRQVAAYQEEMIRESRMPRVNAFLQTNLHSSTLFGGGSSWALGMNVQWNIFDGMATSGRIQEAKAQEREAMYNYEAAKSNTLAEVNKSSRSLKTAKTRIAVASKSLEEAKVSFDFIGKKYKTGMAMTFELLMREQAFTYAKMRLNQAMYDYCVSKRELEYYKGGS